MLALAVNLVVNTALYSIEAEIRNTNLALWVDHLAFVNGRHTISWKCMNKEGIQWSIHIERLIAGPTVPP